MENNNAFSELLINIIYFQFKSWPSDGRKGNLSEILQQGSEH